MKKTNPESYLLIADDDKDDSDLLADAIREVDPERGIVVVDNGKMVIEYLEKKEAQNLPCLLVMDLNMPRMDGREAVVALKAYDHLKSLPILLLSTSKNRTDDLFAKKWGVNYFQKPDTVQGLKDAVKLIMDICGNGS